MKQQLFVFRAVNRATGEVMDKWRAHKGSDIWTNNRRNFHVYKFASHQEAQAAADKSCYNTTTIKVVAETW